MNHADLTALADAYADGTLDEPGLATLQAALRSDAGLRRAYLHIMRGHHQVRAIMQAASSQADVPRRPTWRGPPLLLAAALAIAVGLAAIVLRPDPLRVAAMRGDLRQEIAGVAVPVAIGDRVAAGTRLTTGAEATLRLASSASALDLASGSDVEITANDRVRLLDGEATLSGQVLAELASTPLRVHGGASIQAAPWAVLLRLDPGSGSDLPGLAAGGWARRGRAADWTVHAPEAMATVGDARLVARYLAHYRTRGRFLIEDSVAIGAPRWTPNAAEFLARARHLGGAVDGLGADGDVIDFPAAGQHDLRRHLPIGRLLGGLSMRLRHGFRLDVQRPMAGDGRPGNGFDLSFGIMEGVPFTAAPAARLSQPSHVQGDQLTDLELRILPVGRSGDQELSEIGIWADGRLFMCGWLRGSVLTIGTTHRGGRMHMAGVRVAELWDTLPPAP